MPSADIASVTVSISCRLARLASCVQSLWVYQECVCMCLCVFVFVAVAAAAVVLNCGGVGAQCRHCLRNRNHHLWGWRVVNGRGVGANIG